METLVSWIIKATDKLGMLLCAGAITLDQAEYFELCFEQAAAQNDIAKMKQIFKELTEE